MGSKYVLKKRENANHTPVGQYIRAIKKYDIKLTSPITALHKQQQQRLLFQNKAADHDGTGEVEAFNAGEDVLYYAELTVGTPPQKFKVDLDTGSADFWLVGANAKKSDQAKHNVYHPKKSSTFKSLPGFKWEILYGDQSTASGTVGTDVVSIGGIEVKDQAVEVADHISASFVHVIDDGLMGLGFSSGNNVKPEAQLTPIDNMIKQGSLKEPLFAAKLVAGETGEYTFGYYDESDAVGEIYWTPVATNSVFWRVQSSTATINRRHITRSGNTGIVDTGSTLAIVSDDFLKEIYKDVPGAENNADLGGWVFPKSALPFLPTVEVAIGDKLAQIPNTALCYGKVGEDDKTHEEYFYGGFQSRGDLHFDIYGDIVLKHMLAIFDVGNKRFGFARRPDVKYVAN